MKEFVEKLIGRLEEVAIETLGISKGQFSMDKGEYLSYCSLSLYDVKEQSNQLAEEYKEKDCSQCSRRSWYQKGYADAERNNGWIPCEKELPETNESVLCWAKSTARGGDVCFVGSYHKGFWFLQSSANTHSFPGQYKIVAWQPLPAPYQKGE